MSREIKYRAFYKKTNKYYKVMAINFHTKEICIGVAYDNIWVSINCVSLERYIGLQDKNNIDVYEGDIIKDFYFPKNIGLIKWNDKHASYQINGVASSSLKYLNRYEVIGTLNENKELLK